MNWSQLLMTGSMSPGARKGRVKVASTRAEIDGKSDCLCE